eukprot:CAMPEP_0177221496 /NCGR_PEP_ID=MMETSP0367-20130122/37446_1 /TAXON_ID=447022 ORGANISM="Scrippsiella hangoei-like, Strain SHHI-4" /NCGR_SAMPLE_ID=MMETSP0367 /ASSEMBLY_ACC=CAM_ASM_000362 /LENGTH=94 /DNA_ID=CAMNT_0018671331 /DNA_START=89 /DNA_END=373 /DNA_ORIENTATION=+
MSAKLLMAAVAQTSSSSKDADWATCSEAAASAAAPSAEAGPPPLPPPAPGGAAMLEGCGASPQALLGFSGGGRVSSCPAPSDGVSGAAAAHDSA